MVWQSFDTHWRRYCNAGGGSPNYQCAEARQLEEHAGHFSLLESLRRDAVQSVYSIGITPAISQPEQCRQAARGAIVLQEPPLSQRVAPAPSASTSPALNETERS